MRTATTLVDKVIMKTTDQLKHFLPSLTSPYSHKQKQPKLFSDNNLGLPFTYCE